MVVYEALNPAIAFFMSFVLFMVKHVFVQAEGRAVLSVVKYHYDAEGISLGYTWLSSTWWYLRWSRDAEPYRTRD